jgi:hypothetical protein
MGLFINEKGVPMKFKLPIACALLASATTSAFLRAESSNSQNLSRADLKRMVQSAHTTEDYLTLASYYRWRQQQFEEQAQSEKAEWARRAANGYLAAAKYPNPVDSSKYRYEYFEYESQKMSQQAAHYETLSASAGQSIPQ